LAGLGSLGLWLRMALLGLGRLLGTGVGAWDPYWYNPYWYARWPTPTTIPDYSLDWSNNPPPYRPDASASTQGSQHKVPQPIG